MAPNAFVTLTVDVNGTVPVGSIDISESHNAAVSVPGVVCDLHENDTFVT